MTEDTSPENLRKFLESDDPAMVTMGLSMAKGSGVSEGLMPIILKMYMLNEDKNIRAMAKSVFTKWAPDEIQLKVKENWKANYRTLSITGDKYPDIVKPFLDAFKSNDDIAMIVLTPLLNIYSKKIESTDWEHWGQQLKLGEKRSKAGENLTKIADIRTLGPLTKILLRKNEVSYHQFWAAKALGNIGDSRALKSLIASFGADNAVTNEAISALAKIGDARAIKPILLRYLEYESPLRAGQNANYSNKTRNTCKNALNMGKWEWTNKPEVKEIIKLLKGGKTKLEPKTPDDRLPTRPSGADYRGGGGGRLWTPAQLEIRKKWDVYEQKRKEYQNWKKIRRPWARAFVAKLLGKIGDEEAVKPLIKLLNDENIKIVETSIKSLGEIGDKRAIEPITKFLNENQDRSRFYSGYDWSLPEEIQEAGKEALKNLSHRVE